MPPGLQVDKELSQSDLDKASGSHCPGLRELQVTPPSVPTRLSPGTSPVVSEGFLVPPGHVNTTQCDCLFSSFLNFILAETRQSQMAITPMWLPKAGEAERQCAHRDSHHAYKGKQKHSQAQHSDSASISVLHLWVNLREL